MQNALGSFNSLYMAAIFGYFGHYAGMFKMTPVSTPLLSSCGALSIARNVAVVSGPAIVGLAFGCIVFGNPAEVKSLIINNGSYRRDFRGIKNELYYM